jgi:hypothetical protein
MPLGAFRINTLGKSQAVAATPDITQAVEFDGASDRLQYSGALAGSDSTNFLCSLWFYHDTADTESKGNFIIGQKSGSKILVFDGLNGAGDGKVYIYLRDSGGTTRLQIQTANEYWDGEWHHMMASWNGTTAHLYIDGVSDKVENTNSNSAIAWNFCDTWGVGGRYDGLETNESHLAEVYCTNEYLDLSSSANRDKFFDSTNRTPVSLGTDGSTPTGTQPLIYFSGEASVWNAGTNFGSTTGWSMGGSVTDSTVEPIVFSVDPRTTQSVPLLIEGDLQISTAQSQFGGSSLLFDGTDHFTIPSASNDIDWSGDFTVEYFVRFNTLPTGGVTQKLSDWRGIATGGSCANAEGQVAFADCLIIQYQGTNGVQFFIDSVDRGTGTRTLSANTWYHIAMQRSGTTIEAWLDGTRVVNYTQSPVVNYNSTVWSVNQPNFIYMNDTTFCGTGGLDGYVDEFRISNSARYTAGSSTITVPTSAFTPDGDTALLIHGDGTNGSTDITDDPPALTGLTAIDPGTIRIGSSTITTKPASDSPQLTLSFWWRQNSDGTNDHVFNMQSGTSTTTFPGGTKLLFCEIYRGRVRLGSLGYWDIQVTDTGANPESSYGNGWWDNNWHHFVYSVSASNVDTLYVDGVDRTSSIYATTPGSGDTVNWSTFNRMSLLSFWGATSDFSGGDITQVFIDNSYYDLSNATTRAKFYDSGAVDMGSDGTGTGLTQPLVFHTGDTTTFFNLGGDTSRFNYGNTTTGTADGDISASDGPQF